MEWTPTRIRLLREVELCLSQSEFAKSVGFAKRTVGNAERGTHTPSLALRRALDHVLEAATDAPGDRFLVAVAAREHGNDALAVLHLLEAERVTAQAVSRNKSATTLLSILLARERRSATPGLRGLVSRAGLLL